MYTYDVKMVNMRFIAVFQIKEVGMKNELTEGVKVLNIVLHSFFSLIIDIFVAIGISWLLVEKLGAPDWTYAVIIIVGVMIGLLSMLRFILAAFGNMEKIERDKQKENEDRMAKEKKQRELRDFFKTQAGKGED